MDNISSGKLNYQSLIEEAGDCTEKELIEFLMKELPYLWRDVYFEMTSRKINVVSVQHDTFEFYYDDLDTLEATGEVPYSATAESRLVGVLGRSAAPDISRGVDDARLKGFVGATESVFGKDRDKGHFIAHSMGGLVAGVELNVFVQRRDLNRGWSAEGKVYREMEKYCADNPGTFCFSRPIYMDETAKPAFLEFGILKNNKILWVECFDNR